MYYIDINMAEIRFGGADNIASRRKWLEIRSPLKRLLLVQMRGGLCCHKVQKIYCSRRTAFTNFAQREAMGI